MRPVATEPPNTIDVARHALTRVIAAWPQLVDVHFAAHELHPLCIQVVVSKDGQAVSLTFTYEALIRDRGGWQLGVDRAIEKAIYQWDSRRPLGLDPFGQDDRDVELLVTAERMWAQGILDGVEARRMLAPLQAHV